MDVWSVRPQSVHVRGGIELEFLRGVREGAPGRSAISIIVDGRHHRVHFDINGWASRIETLPLPAAREPARE
jgi:hypothetical protein